MSGNTGENRQRLEELTADRALFGLSLAEQAELNELIAAMPDWDIEQFDRVAAAIDVAGQSGEPESLPADLRSSILAQATAHLSPAESPAKVDPAFRARTEAITRPSALVPWLAAALCLLVAAYVWYSGRPAPTTEPTATEQRQQLVAEANDLIEVAWSPGPTPTAGAAGDVVWSPSRQEGFMRFRGMAKNDATEEQYQLWIFDRNQSEATPVDGGVFDIDGDDVVVPIQAKLPVQEAYLFAITVEKPGGVVVSSRARLPLLAAVE